MLLKSQKNVWNLGGKPLAGKTCEISIIYMVYSKFHIHKKH